MGSAWTAQRAFCPAHGTGTSPVGCVPGDQRDRSCAATGRGAWVGGLELATEPVDETTTRMTAQDIHDVGADIQAVVEAEDRPSLDRFNTDLLADRRIGAQSQGS